MLSKILTELNYREYFGTKAYAVLDFETTNKSNGSALEAGNRIVGWVLYDGKRDRVYRAHLDRDPDAIAKLLKHLKRVELLVAHNAKFELQWLYRHGLDPCSILVWDTMLAEYVIAGNRIWDLSLNGLAKRYGFGQKESYVAGLIHGGVCPSEIPEKRLLDYCQQDVALTNRIFHAQRELMYDEEYEDLLPVLFTRALTCIVLADIEFRGMYVDADEVSRLYTEELKRSRDILGKMDAITGGINPKSPKQVAEFLYDNLGFDEPTDARGNVLRTPAGGRKTDEATISSLVPVNDRQRAFSELFLSYAPVKKRLETLTKLQECAKSADRLVKANFNQCVTRTHRLSSTGRTYKVQFHNIDRDFKRLFVPRDPDYLLGEADAPQLEFRIAGELCDDDQVRKDVKDRVDVHRNTAAVLLRKVQSRVTKAERTYAKRDTFRPLYGGNSGTEDQKRYFAWFRDHYKSTNDTQKSWCRQVLKDKKLVTRSGLRFYWPDCTADARTGYIKHTTEIFNYPVQSFATAEIIPISVVYLWWRLKDLRSFLINTVHDSVVCEVHKDEIDEWKAAVKQSFVEDVYNYLDKVYRVKFKTMLGVGFNLGKYWSDGEEELYEKENMDALEVV